MLLNGRNRSQEFSVMHAGVCRGKDHRKWSADETFMGNEFECMPVLVAGGQLNVHTSYQLMCVHRSVGVCYGVRRNIFGSVTA